MIDWTVAGLLLVLDIAELVLLDVWIKGALARGNRKGFTMPLIVFFALTVIIGGVFGYLIGGGRFF